MQPIAKPCAASCWLLAQVSRDKIFFCNCENFLDFGKILGFQTIFDFHESYLWIYESNQDLKLFSCNCKWCKYYRYLHCLQLHKPVPLDKSLLTQKWSWRRVIISIIFRINISSWAMLTYPSPNSTTVNWQQFKVDIELGEG